MLTQQLGSRKIRIICAARGPRGVDPVISEDELGATIGGVVLGCWRERLGGSERDGLGHETLAQGDARPPGAPG